MKQLDLHKEGPDTSQWYLTTDEEKYRTCVLCGKELERGFYCKQSDKIYCDKCAANNRYLCGSAHKKEVEGHMIEMEAEHYKIELRWRK